MKSIKKVVGQTGHLPIEFCDLYNYSSPNEFLSDTDIKLIAFVESYGGEYKDEYCNLKILIEN